MKCANCKHNESSHENVILKRLGKPDVEMKPCLSISLPMGEICGCKSYVAPGDMEKFVERRFKESVISAIQEYDSELNPGDAPEVADIAWRKYTGDTE